MSIIDVDLSLQEYPVFDIDKKNSVRLSEVNFIFGKNGSGKSSFSELIRQQCGYDGGYGVYIYKGMQDLLVNDKLNTIVLGEDNKEAKTKISEIEYSLEVRKEQLKSLEEEQKSLCWKKEYEDQGIKKHSLFLSKELAEKEYKKKGKLIEDFYTFGARKIREYNTSLKLALGNYNKNDFKKEIDNAKKLDDEKIDDLSSKITETLKSKVSEYKKCNQDYQQLLNEVNNMITFQPKQLEMISELKDSDEKKSFAIMGKELHRPGEICSFCGQIYSEERAEKLEHFFSVEDMEEINTKIDRTISKIDKWLEELDLVIEIKGREFYNFLSKDILKINSKIKNKKSMISNYLNVMKKNLEEKRKNSFVEFELLDIEVPDSLNLLIDEVNIIIEKHNAFNENIKDKQEEARKELRLSIIYEIISDKDKYQYEKEWRGYTSEISVLMCLKKIFLKENESLEQEIEKVTGENNDTTPTTINGLNYIIKSLEEERKEYLKSTKNTKILAQIINDKLSSSGKKDLQLKVCNKDDDVECYMILDEKGGVRDISKISTGEKNIIAFLYFIGNLKSQHKKNKKIIIFDDPMNSNDDTLQYLIITELQKLYRGTNKIFEKNNDIFVCMTHNVHFYLNVQPQGHFKDKNGKSKYEKNNFYILRNKNFFKVENHKEDFKTSYEALWMELNDLYQNNYLNSMLNSMRRIVETFMKFNKIEQDKFYEDKDEHLKIFNVNSHGAIDTLSADSIGKTKEELSSMFKELFIQNGYEPHYNSYWK